MIRLAESSVLFSLHFYVKKLSTIAPISRPCYTEIIPIYLSNPMLVCTLKFQMVSCSRSSQKALGLVTGLNADLVNEQTADIVLKDSVKPVINVSNTGRQRHQYLKMKNRRIWQLKNKSLKKRSSSNFSILPLHLKIPSIHHPQSSPTQTSRLTFPTSSFTFTQMELGYFSPTATRSLV